MKKLRLKSQLSKDNERRRKGRSAFSPFFFFSGLFLLSILPKIAAFKAIC